MTKTYLGGACIIGLLGGLGCSSHPEEGTVVEPGPGVAGIPGEAWGVSSENAAPISGGTLTVNGRTAIAADPDRDAVFVVNLDSRRVDTIALEPGDEPGRSVVDASGRAHVALRRGGAVLTIDLATRTVTSRRSVCPAPRGIAHDPATDTLHVACDTGELVSLPASGGDATRRLALGRDLRDVIVRGASLVVTRFRRSDVLLVDSAGNVTKTLRPRNSATTFASTVGFEPAVAWRAVAAPEGRVAIVHERSNPGEINVGASGYYVTSDVCAGGIVHGTVSTIDPEETTPSTTPMALPLVVGPSDIAISPDGTQVAVVSTGNSWPVAGELVPNVLVMPLDSVGAQGSCGGGQHASGEVVAVAFDETSRVIVQSREPAQLEILGGETISLSDESRADTGTALFHMNSGFGVACASCHPEGRDDGRVWQFVGIGPRRTQTFAGGLLDTAPFHWDGDMSDLSALVHEVFVSRMGGPQPNRQQIEHFSKFLDRIPAPVAPALDHDAVARGRTLFEDAAVGCASCHEGENLTNNQSFDVGTGGVFQVPSLVGVGARAPFMHDGCATTLADRFGPCGGGDAHGVTSSLDDREVADLVSYLSSL